MKKKKLPIGFSDFKDVITGDYYYLDKTLFIKEVIDSGDKILLLPRPRRLWPPWHAVGLDTGRAGRS